MAAIDTGPKRARHTPSLQKCACEIDRQGATLCSLARNNSNKYLTQEVDKVLTEAKNVHKLLRGALREAFTEMESWDGVDPLKLFPSLRRKIRALKDTNQLALANIVTDGRDSHDLKDLFNSTDAEKQDRFYWKVSSGIAELLRDKNRSQSDILSFPSIEPLARIAELLQDEPAFRGLSEEIDKIHRRALAVLERIERLNILLRKRSHNRIRHFEDARLPQLDDPSELLPEKSETRPHPAQIRPMTIGAMHDDDALHINFERRMESLSELAKKISGELYLLESNMIANTERSNAYSALKGMLSLELEEVRAEIDEVKDRLRFSSGSYQQITSNEEARHVLIYDMN